MAETQTIPATQQLLINGEWRDASSGATHDVVNSFTGDAVTRQAAASAADVDAAVKAAAETLPEWSAMPAAERGALLAKAGDILESRAIQSGICHVNGATVHDEPSAPFGGVKASGWGRFGSGQVAHEFTTTRWITVSEEPRHYPI
jgi:acyl-CoA reductase-like NAD-dependent aldehyde dehydrogenase